MALELVSQLCIFEILQNGAKYRSILILFRIAKRSIEENMEEGNICNRWQARGGGGSSIVKVPGDVPPKRVYFFGLLV